MCRSEKLSRTAQHQRAEQSRKATGVDREQRYKLTTQIQNCEASATILLLADWLAGISCAPYRRRQQWRRRHDGTTTRSVLLHTHMHIYAWTFTHSCMHTYVPKCMHMYTPQHTQAHTQHSEFTSLRASQRQKQSQKAGQQRDEARRDKKRREEKRRGAAQAPQWAPLT